MVDMFMADKDKDVVILFQFFRCELLFRGQFSPFSAPVIEDGQRVLARNGKTAVIEMGDQQVLLHEEVHLHGNAIASFVLQPRKEDKSSISKAA